MTQQIVPDDVPGSVLFSEYATLYDWVAREVEGLTEAQLDLHSTASMPYGCQRADSQTLGRVAIVC
jgi:hypothetical protein